MLTMAERTWKRDSVLQSVAVCCSVMQGVAGLLRMLALAERMCKRDIVLQCVAVCWSVLQCLTGCCRTVANVDHDTKDVGVADGC